MRHNAKYELTDESRVVKDEHGVEHTVRRIRALRELKPFMGGHVRPGDLGGWVERVPGETYGDHRLNLVTNGECWVYPEATVMGGARVSGDGGVFGYAVVSDQARVMDSAVVSGHAAVFGFAGIAGKTNVCGDARVFGRVSLADYVVVCDDAQVHGRANLHGNTHVGEDANVSNVNLSDAVIRENALVTQHGHVVTINGLTGAEPVTLYRAADEAGHRVVGGCQTFTLDTDLKRLAAEHGWELAPSWRSMRLALKQVVRSWEPEASWDSQG